MFGPKPLKPAHQPHVLWLFRWHNVCAGTSQTAQHFIICSELPQLGYLMGTHICNAHITRPVKSAQRSVASCLLQAKTRQQISTRCGVNLSLCFPSTTICYHWLLAGFCHVGMSAQHCSSGCLHAQYAALCQHFASKATMEAPQFAAAPCRKSRSLACVFVQRLIQLQACTLCFLTDMVAYTATVQYQHKRGNNIWCQADPLPFPVQRHI